MKKEFKPVLDRYEDLGNGYDLHSFKPTIDFGTDEIFYYMATESRFLCDHHPFNWYLQLVIEGARENALPGYYIERLERIETQIDPNSERRIRNYEILGW